MSITEDAQELHDALTKFASRFINATTNEEREAAKVLVSAISLMQKTMTREAFLLAILGKLSLELESLIGALILSDTSKH